MPDAAHARFVQAIDRLTGEIVTLLERAGIDTPRPRAISAVAEMVGAIAISRALVGEGSDELLVHAKVSVEHKLGLA